MSRIELLKRELATNLGLALRDVLTRKELAAELGCHLKSLSNAGASAPAFYLGALGRNGVALYIRRDIREWSARKVGRREGRQAWPPEMTTAAAKRAILEKWQRGLADHYGEKGEA